MQRIQLAPRTLGLGEHHLSSLPIGIKRVGVKQYEAELFELAWMCFCKTLQFS